MQNTNLGHQYYLSGQKTRVIVLFSLLALLSVATLEAQTPWFGRQKRSSKLYARDARSDLKKQGDRLTRRLNFGFFIAPLVSGYREKLTDEFINTPNFVPDDLENPDVLVNVNPKASLGFAVGFYASLRLTEFLDLRVHTNAAFYERQIEYEFQSGEVINKVIESPMFELPILFKYRSQIRGLHNMYMVAGIKPAFVLSRRTDEEANVRPANTDLSIEYGLGFDVFFPFFRFAPELRFSHGLINTFEEEDQNAFSQPIRRLTTHTATLYLHFGG